MRGINKRLAVKKLKKLCFTPKMQVSNFRAALQKMFSQPILPCRVDCRSSTAGTVPYDVLAPELCARDQILLYVHGGSFVGGARESWRGFCSLLATESSMRLALPEYRLAPEFPYPLAIEDMTLVFDRLCAQGNEVYLAADTSGASIALGFLLTLSEERRQSVKGIVLFSPWLDISPASAAFTAHAKKRRDPVFRPEVLQSCAPLYTYEGNFENPYVSPLYASDSDLATFPPVFIQAGGGEALIEDMRRFAHRLTDCGIQNTLDVWPEMCHFFQFVEEYTTDANIALSRAGKFIKRLVLADSERKAAENSPETESSGGFLRAAQSLKSGSL